MAPRPSTISSADKTFTLSPVLHKFAGLRAPESILTGPRGTGKTRVVLEIMHRCATIFPGYRGLIVRKTRESLTESGLLTFEREVVPPGDPVLAGASRRLRQAYQYPNGSAIVVGGMDRPGKIMSTAYDQVYAMEAIELLETDWEALLSCCDRPGLVMPYGRVMGCTNPDRPKHWILERARAGKLTLVETRHRDNPSLWDVGRSEWTEAGIRYMARLEALTGVQRSRLLDGKWVQAEGLVYDGWDPAIHLVDRFEVPDDWPRYWSVDFGFIHAFTWQEWAEDPDGRLYLVTEIYRTKRLVEEHARVILRVTAGHPAPRAIICDHDAEGRATLERHLGIETTAAHKAIREGIQAFAARLKVQADGKPRVMLFRDALVEDRDVELAEAMAPTRFAEELDGYIWDKAAGRREGEEPVKKRDEGCDAARYMVAALDVAREEVGTEGHVDESERRQDQLERVRQRNTYREFLGPLSGHGSQRRMPASDDGDAWGDAE